MTVTLLISLLCLVLIIVVTVILIYRDYETKLEVQRRIDVITNEINEVNTYKYLADKKQQDRLLGLELEIDSVKKNYVSKQQLQNGFKTEYIDVKSLAANKLQSSDITSAQITSKDYTGDNIKIQRLQTYIPTPSS